MTTQYSMTGACRFGVTRFGYHSGKLLCQIGKRRPPSRFGKARFGASRFGTPDVITNQRHLRKASLNIQDTLDEVPTCSFTMLSDAANRPRDGHLVIIAVGTLQNRLFAGYLSSPKETRHGGPWYQYDCTVQGFSRDFQRRLVSATYQNQYTGEIIQDLVTRDTQGFFWAGDMQKGVLIEEISFNFVTVWDACLELAERSGYVFYVDAMKEVHFKPQDKHIAPWEVSAQERYTDLSIDEDSSELKNRVIVRYTELRDMTQSFKGDGTKKEFTLIEEPYEVTKLQVNGADVTFGTRYAEDNSEHDFSVNTSEKYLTNSEYAVLTADDTLNVWYQGKILARLIVNDRESQQRRAQLECSDGIYESVIEDREILSQADALLRAQDELRQYSSVRVSASYRRYESVYNLFRHRLKVGMQQRITTRGRDQTLTVNSIGLSVLVHEDNHRLTFAQNVSLSPGKSDLTSVFREILDETGEQESTASEIEYEVDLEP